MTRTLLRYGLIGVVTAAASLAIVFQVKRRVEATDASLTPAPFAKAWRNGSEQEWMVAEVVRALADMSHYAQTRSAPDPAALEVVVTKEADPSSLVAFRVEIPARRKSWTVRVHEHILSPVTYAPLAADLLGAQAIAAAKPGGVNESTTLAALTGPRTDVMVAESQRVSSELALDMANAAAHDDAALLFATLALREYSGHFYDNHRSLCRLAAHLAMASALRNGAEPTLAGRYAEITLLTLVFAPQRLALGRLEALEAMPNPSATVQAWNRTLRMRNTEDWRVLPRPATATLLERLEYLTWISWKAGLANGLEFLDQTDLEDVPDWGSRILSGSLSVEAGHRFVPGGLTLILNDAAAMPLGLGRGAEDAEPKRIAAALNVEPAAGPVRAENGRVLVEVLDRGTWAAWTQRHLLHHVEMDVWFTEEMLGMPDEAKAWTARFEQMFGGLRQFPFVARRLAKDAPSYEGAMRSSLALLGASPEGIGGHNWNVLLLRPRFAAASFAVPPVEAWCNPLFPAGTYFEWPKRLWRPDGHLRVYGPPLQAMRDALPHYSNVVRAAVAARYGDKATVAQLKDAYGPLVEYDINVMGEVAEAAFDDPTEYTRIRRRMGELDADQLNLLGYYLVERGELVEAARVYEDFIARGRDRVLRSNSVRWFVDYLFDTGKKERALQIAREAAEVYSGTGLETLALLYERMERWTDAAKYFRERTERYEGNEPALLAFYIRRQRAKKEGQNAAEREALLRKVFPAGLEPVRNEVAAPTDGVEVLWFSPELNKAGLAVHDVIVAVDGVRVHTHDQYLTTRALRREPEMTLRVWRRDRYLDLVSHQFDRRFWVAAGTYRAPAAVKRLYI